LEKEIMVLDDDGNELLLPKSENDTSRFLQKGNSTRAIVLKVEMFNGSQESSYLEHLQCS
jgi:N utilization substance protein A